MSNPFFRIYPLPLRHIRLFELKYLFLSNQKRCKKWLEKIYDKGKNFEKVRETFRDILSTSYSDFPVFSPLFFVSPPNRDKVKVANNS